MHCDSGNQGILKIQTPITVIFRITVVVLVMKAAQSKLPACLENSEFSGMMQLGLDQEEVFCFFSEME